MGRLKKPRPRRSRAKAPSTPNPKPQRPRSGLDVEALDINEPIQVSDGEPASSEDGGVFDSASPIRVSSDQLSISAEAGSKNSGSITITANERCRLRLRVRGDEAFSLTSPNPSRGIELEAGEQYVALVLFAPEENKRPKGALEIVSSTRAGSELELSRTTRIKLAGRTPPQAAKADRPYFDLGRKRPRQKRRKKSGTPFQYSVLSARSKAPGSSETRLSKIVYVRDRLRINIASGDLDGPIELSDDTAKGFALLDQSRSMLSSATLKLRAEVPGSYKIRFDRGGRSNGDPIDVVILPEARRPRMDLLDPNRATRSSKDRAKVGDPTQLRCDNAVNEGAEGCYLTSEQRDYLRGQIIGRINLAVTRFTSAVQVVSEQISSELAVERAFWRVLFEVAFGAGVGKIAGLVGSGLSKAPDNLRADLREHAADVVGNSAFVRGPLTVVSKHSARIAASAYRPGREALFAAVRKFEQIGAQAAMNEIGGFTDPELIAAFEIWDVNNAPESAYVTAIRTIISRWETQVQPIGEIATAPNRSLARGRAVWIADGRLRRLALALRVQGQHVRGQREPEYGGSRVSDQGEVIRRRGQSARHPQGSPSPSAQWHFETWIDPDMQDMAIGRAGGPSSIPVLKRSQFVNHSEFDVD